MLYLKVGFETPQKEKKLGEKVSEKASFQVGMDLQKVRKQLRQGMLQNNGGPSLASNAMYLHPKFALLLTHNFYCAKKHFASFFLNPL